MPSTSEHRLNMTRVDADELVDKLMSGINFNKETTEESKYNILPSFSSVNCTDDIVFRLSIKFEVLSST